MNSVVSANRKEVTASSPQAARPAWRQSWWWTLLRRKPLGLSAASVILVLVLVALIGPWIAPDPYEQFHPEPLRPPSGQYWSGTDRFGRDMLSRVLQGTRIAMMIGFLAMGFGTTVGALLGALSGYIGGWFDLIVQRIMDVLLAFPLIVLAMGMLALVQPSVFNIAAALALLLIPRTSKVIRTVALSVREHLYVEAARASGA